MLNNIRYYFFFFPLLLLVIVATIVMFLIGPTGVARFDSFMRSIKKKLPYKANK